MLHQTSVKFEHDELKTLEETQTTDLEKIKASIIQLRRFTALY